jgi:hypothetical protein
MVYLLCFHAHLHHARHYLGFCDGAQNLDNRMALHRSGRGAKLVAAAVKAGIDFDVVRIWPNGDRNFERKLKNQKNGPRLCPMCEYRKKIFTVPMTANPADDIPAIGPDFPIIPKVG